MKDGYLDFDEYIRQAEPSQKEKAGYWQTAIGLQAVDGLTVSDYLQDTARRHIEGDITIDDARELVNQYYITKTAHDANDEDKEEADRVSSNIVKVLSSPTFNFTTGGYQSVHRRVFEGVLKHAGVFRTYNITKKEWVLEGDTVLYLNWEDLRLAIDYDLEQERAYTYKGKAPDELITHLARFVSGLWQIHAYGEGNTRTTAVFTIQYLRSLGFDVDNDQFAKHSWYFRNALVRANYRNVTKAIEYTPVFLERFFRNLLLILFFCCSQPLFSLLSSLPYSLLNVFLKLFVILSFLFCSFLFASPALLFKSLLFASPTLLFQSLLLCSFLFTSLAFLFYSFLFASPAFPRRLPPYDFIFLS